MTYYERLNEMKDTIELTIDNAREDYLKAEAELVSLFSELIKDAEVSCKAFGEGKIIEATGDTLEAMIVSIAFAEVRKFSLIHVMNNNFIKIINEELKEAWNEAFVVHTELTTKYKELERAAKQRAIEEAKKAEAEKKAEANYQRMKDKAIKDFDNLVKQAKNTLSEPGEFYYAIGWLTKHVGTVSAALPDYLATSFAKHFGPGTPCRVVDSKKKGPAGYASQWTWSFSASLKKFEDIPSILVPYLNPTGKAVSDTSFVWDLVDNYGFQFGKNQDVEKIKNTIPVQHMSMFEAGLVA